MPIWIVALAGFGVLGAKVIWNVVLPPAGMLIKLGVEATKSLEPVTVIGVFKFRVDVPMLLIVKVRTTDVPNRTVLPKSVPSLVLTVVLPSIIGVLLPESSISGVTPVP